MVVVVDGIAYATEMYTKRDLIYWSFASRNGGGGWSLASFDVLGEMHYENEIV